MFGDRTFGGAPGDGDGVEQAGGAGKRGVSDNGLKDGAMVRKIVPTSFFGGANMPTVFYFSVEMDDGSTFKLSARPMTGGAMAPLWFCHRGGFSEEGDEFWIDEPRGVAVEEIAYHAYLRLLQAQDEATALNAPPAEE